MSIGDLVFIAGGRAGHIIAIDHSRFSPYRVRTLAGSAWFTADDLLLIA